MCCRPRTDDSNNNNNNPNNKATELVSIQTLWAPFGSTIAAGSRSSSSFAGVQLLPPLVRVVLFNVPATWKAVYELVASNLPVWFCQAPQLGKSSGLQTTTTTTRTRKCSATCCCKVCEISHFNRLRQTSMGGRRVRVTPVWRENSCQLSAEAPTCLQKRQAHTTRRHLLRPACLN